MFAGIRETLHKACACKAVRRALCSVSLVSSENFPECEPDDPYEKCQQNQFYHVQNPPRFKMLSYPVFGNADHQNDQHDHAHNSHDFSSPFHIRRSPKMTSFRCVSSFCNYHIIIGGRSKHKTVPKLQSFFGTVFS